MSLTINSDDISTGTKEQVAAQCPRNIAFIDGAVEDKRQLIAGLEPSTAAVILDSSRDGVAQITQYLQQYIKQRTCPNLHIVSHGAPGCLYLGNTQLHLDTLEQYARDLPQWQVENLLLYGCNVATGDAGTQLLENLHAATCANIAASNSRTGNANMGGNWNLEVTVGKISCPIAFSKAVQNTYPGLLGTVNVEITSDTLDGDTSSISALIASPGADGQISLREALMAANNTPGDDRIILASGSTYSLSRAGREEDAAATGDLDIVNNGKITIETSGSQAAVIDAGGIDRVFDVRPGASLALENIEVTGGVASSSFRDDSGGGIRVNRDGSLELTNSTLSSNSNTGIVNVGSASIVNSTVSNNTTSGNGGGISNLGSLSIENSTVRNNGAAGTIGGFGGGGIFNSGSISIESSTISGNTGGLLGGGIGNYYGGTVSIANSHVSGNTAQNGGGINNSNEGSITTIANSTIDGNTAEFGGGGISNIASSMAIVSSTVSGNTAENGGGISNYGVLGVSEASLVNSTVSGNRAESGGGIYNNFFATASIANSTVSGNTAEYGGGISNVGTASIANSIIAANADDKDLENRYDGTFASGGHNLIGNNNGITAFTNGINGDIVGNATTPVDPQLGPLQNNGGQTLTQAPLPGSPAIDNGSTTELTDQRGVSRPQGDRPDIGAVEVGGTPNLIFVDITTDENDGTLGNNSVSLRDAIIIANSNAGDFIIQLAGGQTYNLTIAGRGEDAGATGDLDILDNGKITIQTVGAGKAAIDARGTDRVFEVRPGASLALENIEVTGGVASGLFPDNSGGGIRVNSNGSLELTNSTVNSNTAFLGGGISNEGSTTIANSTLSGNTARVGSGINNFGSASIANSTIRENRAYAGGSIFNDGSASIANSTLSGNRAGWGGGLFNRGTANIANSTISSNTAAYDGGGIYSRGSASIANSTISGNMASNGDGIRNSGTANIANSIIATNGDNEDINNLRGTLTSGGHNLIGNGDGITAFTDGMNGDIVGNAASPVDPGLGPLQDNGGETFTQALLPGSRAINAGNNDRIPIDELDIDADGDRAEAIDIDQRGETRIFDGTVDIGAYEVEENVTVSQNAVNSIGPFTNGFPGNDNNAIPEAIDSNINLFTIGLGTD